MNIDKVIRLKQMRDEIDKMIADELADTTPTLPYVYPTPPYVYPTYPIYPTYPTYPTYTISWSTNTKSSGL